VTRSELGISAWQLVRALDPFDNAIDYFLRAGARAHARSASTDALARSRRSNTAATIRRTSRRSRASTSVTAGRPATASPSARSRSTWRTGTATYDRVLSRSTCRCWCRRPRWCAATSSASSRTPSTGSNCSPRCRSRWAPRRCRRRASSTAANDGVAPYDLRRRRVQDEQRQLRHLGAARGLDGARRVPPLLENLGTTVGTRGVPWANIFLPPTDLDGHPKWAPQFLTRSSRKEQFFSAPGIPNGFRFMDTGRRRGRRHPLSPELRGGIRKWRSRG
jgi:hypothetical protein